MTNKGESKDNDSAKNEEKNSPFLNAWHDPLANLKTIQSCVRLGDINADGDNKLIVCDLDKNLKIFKGTSLITEIELLDTPISCAVIYCDNTVVSKKLSIHIINYLILNFLASCTMYCCSCWITYIFISK